MIETHIVNSMVRPELMATPFYKVVNFINGLVAPAFLFAAGLTFAIATRRKINDYLAFRPALWKQFSRLGLLFVIGYCLHIPKFEYHHLRYDCGVEAWHNFWQVDVLQCIGMTLVVLTVLLLVLRSERRVLFATTLLFVGVLFGSPIIASIDFWTILPIPVAEYLNANHASLFPLFPWSSFVLAGVLAGYYYLQAPRGEDGSTNVAATMTSLSSYAVGAVILSFALHPFAETLYPFYDYWKNSPSFVLLRTGLVVLLLAACYLWERRRGISPSSVMTISGRESLLIYTVHLMILYGNFKGPHLVDRIGHQFGFAEAFGLSAVLIALMIVLAVAWSFIKARGRWMQRSVEGAIVAGLVYVFFMGL